MFFSRVRRFETERARDFRTSRWHTAFGNGILNEPEDLSLTGCEVRHASPVYVDSDCYYIQYRGTGKWVVGRVICRVLKIALTPCSQGKSCQNKSRINPMIEHWAWIAPLLVVTS